MLREEGRASLQHWRHAQRSACLGAQPAQQRMHICIGPQGAKMAEAVRQEEGVGPRVCSACVALYCKA